MRKGSKVIRIIFFIESLSGGGAEKVLRNLVNAMDQSKFDITVQTLYREDAESYLAPGVHYKYCYPAKSRANELRMRAEAASGLTYPLHIKGDYDIEAAYLECGATKIIAGSTNKNALKLAWVHCDLQNRIGDSAAFAAATKKYYAKYDYAVCVSENVRQSFEKLYGSTVHTAVVYNTVDDAEILSKAAEPLPPDVSKRKLTIAAVGRLSAPKNFIRALAAHRRLLDEGVDHDLWIIGEGEERPMLENYIHENHLEESAKLLGFRENPYCLMNAADLLVCSSVYEGFSTFVTEGLILGKPIVTTDVSGMRELLGDSEYGLVTANDDEAFYEGVRRMLTEQGLMQAYAKRAKQRGKDFSGVKLARDTEEFLIEKYTEKMNGS